MKKIIRPYNDGFDTITIEFNDNRFSTESVNLSIFTSKQNIFTSSNRIKNNYWFKICYMPVIDLIDRTDKYSVADIKAISTYMHKVYNSIPSLLYSPNNMNSWSTLNEINKLINKSIFNSLFMRQAYGGIVHAYANAVRERLSRIEFICNIHADSPYSIYRASTLEVIKDYEVYELISYEDFEENDSASLNSLKFNGIFESKTIFDKFVLPLDGDYFDKELLDQYITKLHIMDSAYVEDVNSAVAHFDLAYTEDQAKFNEYQAKFTDAYLKLMYKELVYEDKFKPMLQHYGFTIE